MPVRPNSATFSNSSVDVINAIRNSASLNFRTRVPIVTPDAESIRKIGAIICDDVQLYNEFINTLATRIYKVIITNKLYENPWQKFKKGIVELGEKIEDIFVDLAKPHTYNPEGAYATEFQRELPNVKTAFYVMNYQKFYKVTTSRQELRTAFLSMDGLTSFIAKTITALYTSANYDEYQTMKYMVARHIIDGNIHSITGAAIGAAGAKTNVSVIKQLSNDLTFLSNKYNLAGVYNATDKTNQYILIDSKFDAIMDVEVLASAFNMDKVTFMGHRVLIDGFGNLDNARLAELFYGDNNYDAVSSTEATALNAIPAVVVDENFFQVYDNLIETGEKDIQEGLYWNNWLHRWATFAISPFSNAVAILPSAGTVTSVTVSPATATMSASDRAMFSAATVADVGVSQAVIWSATSSDTTDFEIDQNGILTLGTTVTASDAITVKATSVVDSTKYDTATVTVA